MKKIFLILLGLALFYPALAQTNFRDVTYKEAIAAAIFTRLGAGRAR